MQHLHLVVLPLAARAMGEEEATTPGAAVGDAADAICLSRSGAAAPAAPCVQLLSFSDVFLAAVFCFPHLAIFVAFPFVVPAPRRLVAGAALPDSVARHFRKKSFHSF